VQTFAFIKTSIQTLYSIQLSSVSETQTYPSLLITVYLAVYEYDNQIKTIGKTWNEDVKRDKLVNVNVELTKAFPSPYLELNLGTVCYILDCNA